MSASKEYVHGLLSEATELAKAWQLRGGAADAMVTVEIAKLIHEANRRKEKRTLVDVRPDPVQEARKTPRKPLVIKPGAKTEPKAEPKKAAKPRKR